MSMTRREFGATLAARGVERRRAGALRLCAERRDSPEIRHRVPSGPPWLAAHQGSRRSDSQGHRRARRPAGLSGEPARQRARHDFANALRRRRLHVHRRDEPADAGPVGGNQRRRIRIQGLCDGVGGNGRRSRRSRPAFHRKGQFACPRQGPRQRLPQHHDLHQADQHSRRLEGIQDPRAGHPAVAFDVQGARRFSDCNPVRASSTRRSRPRSSTERRTRLR